MSTGVVPDEVLNGGQGHIERNDHAITQDFQSICGICGIRNGQRILAHTICGSTSSLFDGHEFPWGFRTKGSQGHAVWLRFHFGRRSRWSDPPGRYASDRSTARYGGEVDARADLCRRRYQLLPSTWRSVTYIGDDLANTDALHSRQSRRAKLQVVQHGPARRFSNSRRRQGRQFVLLFRIRPRFKDERQLLRIGGLCSAGKQEVQEPDRCRHLHGFQVTLDPRHHTSIGHCPSSRILIGFRNDDGGICREIVWWCLGIERRTERMRTDFFQTAKLLCLLVVGFRCLSMKYKQGNCSAAANTYSIGLFAIVFR
jgi:hypothetical protein